MSVTEATVETEATATADSALVQLKDVVKTYQRGAETVEVLQKLSLDVPRGDFLALMGPSGSGKTTLMNLLGGLDKPTSGQVIVDGQPVHKLSDSALAKWRARHVGFVFQLYHLLPVLNAQRNVELPLLLTKLSKSERKKRAAAALSLVGLSERGKHKPSELSGGQEQRVGIARAIVTDPTILLCDEPTGDLDRKAGDEILELLKVLNDEHGKTIVMVTHDPHAASRAKRTLFMNKGVLSEEPEA
jgi:putative ABC transport system ATP-binding protein